MDIQEFPLAWRWTSKAHAILPVKVMDQITPHTPAQASALLPDAQMFDSPEGLNPKFLTIGEIATHSIDRREVADWLMARHANPETNVIVSWQRHIAASMPWGIFVSYWDDFCYPSSDDVRVWSPGGSWAVFYRHDETLLFGAGA